MAEKNPKKSLTSFSFSGGDGGFRKRVVGNNRVLGDAHHAAPRGSPAIEYAATFSAPLFREEPISTKLSGTKALDSAPFKTLVAYSKALGAGDLETLRSMATPDKLRKTHALIARADQPAALKTLLPGARDKPQVFVRGQRAVVVFRTGKTKAIESLVHTRRQVARRLNTYHRDHRE